MSKIKIQNKILFFDPVILIHWFRPHARDLPRTSENVEKSPAPTLDPNVRRSSRRDWVPLVRKSSCDGARKDERGSSECKVRSST